MLLVNELLFFADSIVYNATGLLFVLLGVFLLIRVSGFPDLTVDGSFTLGAALYSASMVAELGAVLSLMAAILGGAIGGVLTWTINDRFGVGKVISSVLSMIILILAAPYVSGGSTKGLLQVQSFQSVIEDLDRSISKSVLGTEAYQAHLLFSFFWLMVLLLFGLTLIRTLQTKQGLRLRYLGNSTSPVLVPTKERRMLLLFALVAGNGIVGLGGAIEAQRRGGFTSNMGTGILIVGLAILVLGEAVLKSKRRRAYLTLSEQTCGLLLGCILYCAGVQIILAMQIAIVDIRLLTALFLLLLLAVAGRFHSNSTELF